MSEIVIVVVETSKTIKSINSKSTNLSKSDDGESPKYHETNQKQSHLSYYVSSQEIVDFFDVSTTTRN